MRAGRRRAAVACGGLLLVVLALGGCAKYNTFYNAEQAFGSAERAREDRLKRKEDVSEVDSAQRGDYERAIQKAQKVIDQHPGHALIDDALFLQGKAHHRLQNHRTSIRKLDLLFTNFPATRYEEEALFLQALNYMHLGNVATSQDFLERLDRRYPDSRFQAEALRVKGESSFVLERWEQARDAFEEYRTRFPQGEGKQAIALKLGETYWELGDYESVVPVLQDVLDSTAGTEVGFDTRLLLARALGRIGQAAEAESLLAALRDEAEVYARQGEVALARAEVTSSRGDDGAAAAILENMPPEWGTPVVNARAADVLGYVALRRGDWERAREHFQNAVRGRRELDQPERSAQILSMLQDYLAAEGRLPDASGPERSRLLLLQANGMLFAFDRPRQAADLFLEAARHEEADSLVAARALYGAQLVYRQHLDLPDSAALLAAEVQERFPDSAQAYALSQGARGDLLAFLLERRDVQLQERRQEGAVEPETVIATTSQQLFPPSDTGLRRRKIYRQRGPDIVFAAPASAIAAAARRQAPTAAAAGAQDAGATVPVPGVVSGGIPGTVIPLAGVQAPTAVPDSAVGPLEAAAAPDLPQEEPTVDGAAPDLPPSDRPGPESPGVQPLPESGRLEQEPLEEERLEQERLERERLERERLEQERLERERLEQERLEQLRREEEEVRKREERRRRAWSPIGGQAPPPAEPDTSSAGTGGGRP
ncbi:MAG: tetratricopeptide repeat protein [Candidatus Krumholzibacteriia bacterium]